MKRRVVMVAGCLCCLAVAAAGAIPGFFDGGQTHYEGQVPTGTTAAILQMRMAQPHGTGAAAVVSNSPFDNVAPSLGGGEHSAGPEAPAKKAAPAEAVSSKLTILDQPGMTLMARLR